MIPFEELHLVAIDVELRIWCEVFELACQCVHVGCDVLKIATPCDTAIFDIYPRQESGDDFAELVEHHVGVGASFG